MNKVIFVIMVVISLVGCQSSTMTGVEAGTVVCMINGEEWISTSVEVSMTAVEENILGISAIRAGSGQVEQLNMRIIGFQGEKTYDVLDSSPKTMITFELLGGRVKRYNAMLEGIQQVTITDFDEAAKTISGTFKCFMLGDRTANPAIESELHLDVTEGKFYQLPIANF